MTQVLNLEQLRKLCTNNTVECFIKLNYGAKSSKTIEYYPDKKVWYVFHDIDNSDEELTEKEFKKTLIAEAIEKGALYLY